MGRPAELTKEKLLNYGITKITEDGHVFTDNYERTISIQAKPSRYGVYMNHCFSVYDHDLYLAKKTVENKGGCGMKTISLARAMYAWFHGCAPANMDVDHINGDSLDDRIENLQLLTRAENLAKRKGNVNQYGKRKSERETN